MTPTEVVVSTVFLQFLSYVICGAIMIIACWLAPLSTPRAGREAKSNPNLLLRWFALWPIFDFFLMPWARSPTSIFANSAPFTTLGLYRLDLTGLIGLICLMAGNVQAGEKL